LARIPDALAAAIHQKARESMSSGTPPFLKAEIEDLVDSLDAGVSKWSFLTADSFFIVGRVLIFSESCPAQWEGMYKLYAVLEAMKSGNPPAERRLAYKAAAGQKLISPAISSLCLREKNHPLLKRWTGLLLAELLEADENHTVLSTVFAKKPEFLLRIGKFVIEGDDIILKIVAGQLISELVSHGGYEVLQKVLPEDGFDMPLSVIDVAFPIGSGSKWDAELTQYASKIETWRQEHDLTYGHGPEHISSC
jgi:hypothetical protein